MAWEAAAREALDGGAVDCDLFGKGLGAGGASALGTMLRRNTRVEHLDLHSACALLARVGAL
jgi:hypothetical protein